VLKLYDDLHRDHSHFMTPSPAPQRPLLNSVLDKIRQTICIFTTDQGILFRANDDRSNAKILHVFVKAETHSGLFNSKKLVFNENNLAAAILRNGIQLNFVSTELQKYFFDGNYFNLSRKSRRVSIAAKTKLKYFNKSKLHRKMPLFCFVLLQL